MYYRGANAALLLYDITNASTFDDIRGWLAGEPLFLPHPFRLLNRFIRIKEKLPTRTHHLHCWFQS